MNKPTSNRKKDSLLAAQQIEHSRLQRASAWSVHLLTASGVFCCLLALEATYASEWRAALAWLLLAVIIDAVDGTFARYFRVKTVLPNFDGALLDNLVDFINYVIVPALIIHRAQLVPAQCSFAIACAICLASAYQFCQGDAKTADNYFKGFPSYWNVTALYLLSAGFDRIANLIIIVALIAMVFVPIKYIYVTRTKAYQTITWPLTISWAVLAIIILWQLPNPNPWLVGISSLYFVYYFLMSVYLTIRPSLPAS